MVKKIRKKLSAIEREKEAVTGREIKATGREEIIEKREHIATGREEAVGKREQAAKGREIKAIPASAMGSFSWSVILSVFLSNDKAD